MKVGDKVKIRSSDDGEILTITRIFWRGAAGSNVSYIDSVEVTYENGMKMKADPKRIEIVKEVD